MHGGHGGDYVAFAPPPPTRSLGLLTFGLVCGVCGLVCGLGLGLAGGRLLGSAATTESVVTPVTPANNLMSVTAQPAHRARVALSGRRGDGGPGQERGKSAAGAAARHRCTLWPCAPRHRVICEV